MMLRPYSERVFIRLGNQFNYVFKAIQNTGALTNTHTHTHIYTLARGIRDYTILFMCKSKSHMLVKLLAEIAKTCAHEMHHSALQLYCCCRCCYSLGLVLQTTYRSVLSYAGKFNGDSFIAWFKPLSGIRALHRDYIVYNSIFFI